MKAYPYKKGFDLVVQYPSNQANQTSSIQKRKCTQHSWVAATNPATAQLVLATLARTGIPELLEHIAMNCNTSSETLASMAAHPAEAVRIAVAESPNSSLSTLWQLAKDSCPDVRYSLADNHNIAIEILQALTGDDNPYVSCRARRTLERLRDDFYRRGKKHSSSSQFCSPLKAVVASVKSACL